MRFFDRYIMNRLTKEEKKAFLTHTVSRCFFACSGMLSGRQQLPVFSRFSGFLSQVQVFGECIDECVHQLQRTEQLRLSWDWKQRWKGTECKSEWMLDFLYMYCYIFKFLNRIAWTDMKKPSTFITGLLVLRHGIDPRNVCVWSLAALVLMINCGNYDSPLVFLYIRHQKWCHCVVRLLFRGVTTYTTIVDVTVIFSYGWMISLADCVSPHDWRTWWWILVPPPPRSCCFIKKDSFVTEKINMIDDMI